MPHNIPPEVDNPPAYDHINASGSIDHTYEWAPPSMPVYARARFEFRGNEALVQWLSAKVAFIMRAMGWGGSRAIPFIALLSSASLV